MKKSSDPPKPPSKPPSRLSEDLRQLLAGLHLRRIAEIYDEEMTSADENGRTFNC